MASERATIVKLTEIKQTILKVHRRFSLAQTAGSVASISGTAATVGGMLLAPFTGGVSLGLTAYGLAASVSGAVTYVGTSIISSNQTKKWAEELKSVLESRKAAHRKVGQQIVSSPVWADVVKVATSSLSSACSVGYNVSLLANIQRYVSLFGAEFVDELTAFYFSQSSILGLQYFEVLDSLVLKVVPGASPFVAFRILKSMTVVAGLAFIGLDVYAIVEAWTKDPKLCGEIDKIVGGLEECVRELEGFKREYE